MKNAVLLTGASGGIGTAFAEEFAKAGQNLILIARSTEKLADLKQRLESTYSIQAETISADLSDPAAIEQIVQFTTDRGIAIDVLVNNAGFGDFGPFADCSWEKQNEMVQVNITALIHLTHCYLKPMIERGNGKILNVASTAAFQPGPLMSVYYASKAFVLSFSEALSVELKGTGVTVTVLCPGPTKTGFEAKAELGDSGLFKNLRVAAPQDVAAFGVDRLRRGKVIAVPGFLNRLIVFVSKLSPRAVVRNFVYYLQK